MFVFNAKKANIFIFIFISSIAIFHILTTYSFYVNSFYNYYDLGVVNDLMSSMIFSQKWFYVPQGNLNHLGIHFTPSLLFLSPMYLFSSSNYILIFTNIMAIFIGIIVVVNLAKDWFTKILGSEKQMQVFIMILGFSVWFGLNKYIKTLAASAHYEAFAFPLMLCVLVGILKNTRWWIISLFFIFACGTREDVAFFLFFQLLSLFALPKALFQPTPATRKTLLALIILCPIYALLTVKVIMPSISGAGNVFALRFWGHYGLTWNEVIITMATSPVRVLKDFFSHGFTRFNEAFFYIGIFNPLNFILIHIPGILLYTASDSDKNMLQWYNAALLLPGMLLSVVAGWYKIISLSEKIKIISVSKFINILVAISVVFAIVTLLQTTKLMGKRKIYFPSGKGEQIQIFNEYWSTLQKYCELPKVVATDEYSAVFIPIPVTKYLLKKYSQAQVVIINKSNEKSASVAENTSVKQTIENDMEYQILNISQNFITYAKADYISKCHLLP